MKTTSWALLFVLFLQLIATPLAQSQNQNNQTKRIALVAFRNLSGDPGLDRYKSSIPDQIQTVMAGTGTLRLVERGQLEAALKEMNLGMNAIVDDQTAVKLGKVLQASAIITGSFHKEGNILQFTARVIEVETSEVITGVVERCRVGEDVFSAIDRLANALIDKLQLHQWGTVGFQPPPEITKKPEKKKSKVLLWVGLGVIVLGGGIAAVALGGGGDSGGTGGPEESTTLMDPPARP